MKIVKKVLKTIGKVLLGVLVVAVVFVIGVTIVHALTTMGEKGELADAGYINTVTVNGKDLNYNAYGNIDGEHVIVTISGLGVNDYGVMSHYVTDSLSEDNYIVNIDREGYGFSEDSLEDQTVEHIVDTYRSALKEIGVEGPYVLLPHSIGGIYATYWECTYPEEIEGIVFLDTTEITEDAFFEDMDITCSDYILAGLSKTGLQRFVYDSIYIGPPAWVEEPEISYTRALYTHGGGSFASVSETKLANENLKFVYEMFTETDIPKVMINASSSFETEEDFVEYIEYVNALLTAQGKEEYFDLSDDAKTAEVAQRYIESGAQWCEEQTMPYVEALGNCQYVGIPGDHLIYQQKPDEVAAAVEKFLKTLE
ncbi:MAG: alpha/beta hydrolase [Clostridiales bacterium]|nr:alpha/beta hydrolase [Clostridiales bacterium]